MAKLPLNKVLAALDKKDYGFYDRLSEQEQKEIQPYVLLRYMAFIKGGGAELKDWYIRAANELVNRNFWDIPSKHKRLQWNLLCDISPGMGTQYHQWVPMKKEKKNKRRDTLEQLFPDAGELELDTLEVIYTDDEIKSMLRDRDWDEKSIKQSL